MRRGRLFRAVYLEQAQGQKVDKKGRGCTLVHPKISMSAHTHILCPRCKLTVEVHAELAGSHSEKIKAALAKKKAEGHALGRAPYGWQIQGGKRVVVPHEQDIVRLVKLRRRQGRTLGQVADELDMLGFQSRAGGRFSRMQISRIERGPEPAATGDEGPRHKEEQLPLMLASKNAGVKAEACPSNRPSSSEPRRIPKEREPQAPVLIGAQRGQRAGRTRVRAAPKGQLELF